MLKLDIKVVCEFSCFLRDPVITFSSTVQGSFSRQGNLKIPVGTENIKK